jgi:ferritin-like metal-binding protein YciE
MSGRIGGRSFLEVSAMTDKIRTVDDLFIHDLQDLFSAEEQLVTALRQMASAADAPELRAAFARHLEQTSQHQRRIEKALAEAGTAPNGEVCQGIQGLIAEGSEVIAATQPGPVLDAALIDAARKVEHYEITAYRGAISKAHDLGFDGIASLLETNLQEEELADYRLQQMAEGMMPFSGPGSDPRDDGSEVIVGR